MQERKCSLTAALPFLYPGLFQGLSRLSQTVINSYRICNIRCSSIHCASCHKDIFHAFNFCKACQAASCRICKTCFSAQDLSACYRGIRKILEHGTVIGNSIRMNIGTGSRMPGTLRDFPERIIFNAYCKRTAISFAVL